MAPKIKIPSNKRATRGQSSSSQLTTVTDSHIWEWLRNNSTATQRFEDLKIKKLNVGPFYRLSKFEERRLQELIIAFGCRSLIVFDENEVSIDQLAIFLFYANLCSVDIWTP